jgi:molybdopterin molybdotransferase
VISVAEAQERLITLIAGLRKHPAETVFVTDSVGRVLAEDIVARRDHPPFAASAMDGYAVRWADIQTLPVQLRCIGESHAGKRFSAAIAPGTCVRILTGAPVPEGADTVVVQEDVTRDGETVSIRARPEKIGGHIRRAGLDCAAGQILAAKGTEITAARACLLAAAAVTHVPVQAKPQVDLLMCGDELRLPGQSLGADQIVSTNGLLLSALLKQAGAHVAGADHIVPDDLAAMTAIIRNSDADMLVTAGGASVGDRDFVQDAIKAAGGTVDCWKIAMRPGKPLMIATLDNKLIIGLPGNPVSAFVGSLLFALPAVRALQGHERPFPEIMHGVWAESRAANGPRADYVRSVVTPAEKGLAVRALPVQDSSMLSVLADATALAIVPANTPAVAAGAPVQFLPLF